MISVEQAKLLVEKNSKPLHSILIETEKSLGYILAEDIFAPISHPPFQQSAMDGYAIGHFKNGIPSNKFKLVGEVKAGDPSTIDLKEGEAIRIFTGAIVPKGSMSVIMQEVTEIVDDELVILQTIKEGSNIRPIGEQIRIGELALKKGTVLNAAGIGFLIGLGISSLKVHQKPSIGLIITGSELVKAGNKLQAGQIYESNSATLIAAIESTGITHVETKIIDDTLALTTSTIHEMINNKDIIIVSGGISVGDYDFVAHSLRDLEVEEIFYKVNQKPGKPLFYGKKGKCNIFALPGNPAAALLCYYEYALLLTRILSGQTNGNLEKRTLRSEIDYEKKGERAHFLKAIAKNGSVEILQGQNSSMLHTFAHANAFVYIPHHKNGIKKREEVEVHMIPNC